MNTQSIAIVKHASDGTFNIHLETHDSWVDLGTVAPARDEGGADMADRRISRAGYRRTGLWNYAVAAGYLIATIEQRN